MAGRRECLQRRLSLLAATVALAACTAGPGSGIAAGSAPPPAADRSSPEAPVPELVTAQAVCGRLVATVNQVARGANDGLAGIRQATPTARAAGLRAGYATVIAVFERHAADLDAMDLPELPERAALRDDLLERARRARATLAEESAAFEAEAGTGVGDDEVREQVRRFIHAVEKALAVSQPDIGRRRSHTLRAAFALDASCAHVIPPFPLR